MAEDPLAECTAAVEPSPDDTADLAWPDGSKGGTAPAADLACTLPPDD